MTPSVRAGATRTRSTRGRRRRSVGWWTRARSGASEAAAALARRRRAVGFFLAAVPIFFTAGPVLRYLTSHRYFAVREIEVEGLERLDTAQVLVWLGMGQGSSIWAASPRVLEHRLEEKPAIARASVRRIWPDRLHVFVRERTPRAVLRQGSHAFPVDRSGVVFDEQPLRDVALPIISLGATLPAESVAGATPPAAAKPDARDPKKAAHHPAPPPVAHRAGPGAKDARDVAEWLPARGDLRQAVRVATLLDAGAAGIPVSEIGLRSESPGSGRPELIAYSSDGRLTIRLGWGDWQRKIEAVRAVLHHRAEWLRTEPARAAADRAAAVARAHSTKSGRKPEAVVPPPPVAVTQQSATVRLDGMLDVRDPDSVIARWSPAPAAAGTI